MIFFWNEYTIICYIFCRLNRMHVCASVYFVIILSTVLVLYLIWFDFWSNILWFYWNSTGCCFVLIFIFLVSRLFRNTFMYSTVNNIWTELNKNWIWIEYELLDYYGTVRYGYNHLLSLVRYIYLCSCFFSFYYFSWSIL